MKNVPSVGSLSSRWLAVTCATLYLVVSAVVGAVLLSSPQPAAQAAQRVPTHSTAPGSSTTATSEPPRGFRLVSGPRSVRTVVPVGWPVVQGGAPGALRAADPSDGRMVVGFGGAPAPAAGLAEARLEQERRFAARATGYGRIDLNRATYAGHPAVEWEYRHDDGTGRQRVRTLYWQVDGVEYFVSASAPESRWRRMLAVYEEMVANSRP